MSTHMHLHRGSKPQTMLLHGTLKILIEKARGLKGVGFMCCKGPPTAFVKAYINKCTILKTEMHEGTYEPTFNQTFVLPCAFFGESLTFKVENDSRSAGECEIPFSQIASDRDIDAWIPLRSGHVHKDRGELKIRLRFSPAEEVSQANLEVPHCYFKMHRGCTVRMYQDSVVKEGQLPAVSLVDGNIYSNGSLWEELYHSIQKAEKFIYGTGWSFWVHTFFVRDPQDDESEFGKLLKEKAEAGVRVMLLVWDDQTSGNIFMGKAGLMGTKDEETREFFANTPVIAKLVARKTDEKTSLVKRMYSSSVYTHHQKCTIMDQPDEATGKKKIVAYVGGIDITTGRYDDPSHQLFATMKTAEHQDDFYSNCIDGVKPEFGPRQPWHDIHGYMEGAAAFDVLQNFEERWNKEAVDDHSTPLLELSPDEFVLQGDAAVTEEASPDEWCVQYFRSIDARSAEFKKSIAIEPEIFFSKKGRPVDMSIQSAYVHYIRSAEKFIYVENQYFLGSSTEWKKSSFTDSLSAMDGATHVVPMEIALRVCEKIKAGEHFCAYILLPLYSEGIPESGAVQEIMCWQRNTVQMMYRVVHEELKRNANKHPQKQVTDFLSFFSVGKREFPPEEAMGDPVAKQGRHLIYVHSKMLIVDDSVILIGSANINQRSMDGGRDTEMAFGGHQPAYTVDTCGGEIPKGQIHGFRMSLFAEHFGFKVEDWMIDPSSVESMREARRQGQANWEKYAAEEISEMDGHMMNYPYTVDTTTGELYADPLHPKFPGTNASVLGKDDFFMPDSATM